MVHTLGAPEIKKKYFYLRKIKLGLTRNLNVKEGKQIITKPQSSPCSFFVYKLGPLFVFEILLVIQLTFHFFILRVLFDFQLVLTDSV